jgi:hypothetical protein
MKIFYDAINIIFEKQNNDLQKNSLFYFSFDTWNVMSGPLYLHPIGTGVNRLPA